MTVEGEIAAFGEMAHGAASRRGWSGRLARVLVGLLLLATAAGAVIQLVSLLR